MFADDPWQRRLDRMRLLLPLPLLLMSAAVSLAVPGDERAGLRVELPLVGAAAVLWGVARARLRGNPSTRWRLPVFAGHSALAGVLVGFAGWYGIFAYTGFLFAYAARPALAERRVRGHLADRVGRPGRRLPVAGGVDRPHRTCWWRR